MSDSKAYKRDWMRAKREREYANRDDIETVSDPGRMSRFKPRKNEIRLCYCGCGAVAGSLDYKRHYMNRYKRLERLGMI